MSEQDDAGSDDVSIFEQIEAGERDPIEVIYLVTDEEGKDESLWSGLNDIAGWGEMTGWWNIRFVRTIEEAINEQHSEPAEVFIFLGFEIRDSQRIANEFPYLPQSIAVSGGFDEFPRGWPPQVVVAQWTAPRETEFGNGLETALSKPVTEMIYRANKPDVSLIASVSEELLARLAERPSDRFLVAPRLFEEAVAETLSRMGYNVVGPILTLVECKRYAPNRPVSVEPITRLWSRLFDDKANLALAVTTSYFTPAAHEFAKTRGYQVRLTDGEQFIEWIRSLRAK